MTELLDAIWTVSCTKDHGWDLQLTEYLEGQTTLFATRERAIEAIQSLEEYWPHKNQGEPPEYEAKPISVREAVANPSLCVQFCYLFKGDAVVDALSLAVSLAGDAVVMARRAEGQRVRAADEIASSLRSIGESQALSKQGQFLVPQEYLHMWLWCLRHLNKKAARAYQTVLEMNPEKQILVVSNDGLRVQMLDPESLETEDVELNPEIHHPAGTHGETSPESVALAHLEWLQNPPKKATARQAADRFAYLRNTLKTRTASRDES